MIDRRRVIHGVVQVIALIGATLRGSASVAQSDTPEPDEYRMFTNAEAETFSAWCDLLAIGAADAGVARFVDQSISGPFGNSLILLRYLSSAELSGFYQGGIAGIEQECRHRFSRSFVQLNVQDRLTIVKSAASSNTQAWKTPNPNFFYFISRSDAVDVVYGTQAGFAKLDVPYLAHIEPPSPGRETQAKRFA